MSRILILGAAPLPYEPQRRQYAANLRTWHFTQPLVADGHEVRLVGGRLANTCDEDLDPVVVNRDRGFDYYSVAADLFQDPSYIQGLSDDFDPHAIVGVNTHPASRAAHIDTDKPVWCDLNGWIMAEAQTKCRIYDDDRYLSHFWNMERVVLDRADVISTVSVAQAHATVGELAVRGRLGKESFGYEFVHAIPNAVPEVSYEHSAQVIRGVLVPEDAFVVLWVGGYNTWTDVDLLYDGLTHAMEEVDRLYFVSTGGVIEGHDEITFERFRQRAAASRFADRFHFAGWVPTAHVPSYYFESNLGLNVDSPNYETLFGARNRLNDMMKVGLPVLSTLGTEISEIIAENGIGLTSRLGDVEDFGERVIWAARNAEELEAMGRRARDYVLETFSYARTTAPLRDWAAEPRRAPDMGQRVEYRNIDFFRGGHEEDEAPAPPPAPEADREGPRVHAVIVHHRGQAMLERCLASLLASDGVELDVVVVSNHCQEALPALVDESPWVHRVVSDVSLGFSEANNFGVAWAREHLGEPAYYYFINNDTESYPPSLASLVRELEDRPRAAMAGPKLLILGATDHYNSLGLNVTEDGWGWDEGIGQRVADYGEPPPARQVLSVTGSALLTDAAVFHRIGGWTEVYEYYFEDIDLGIKVWKSGHEVVHVPEAVVLHQISATMTEGSERKNFLFWRNRLFLAVVHWPLGLLLATFRRAVFGEILDKRRTDRPVLRRAMGETLGHLPALLRSRWRWRGDTAWRRFLVPPGSVPVITLPEIGADGPSPQPAPEEKAPPAPQLEKQLQKAESRLQEAESRADHFEAKYHQARGELGEIHNSKMWRLWMFTIAVRRRILRPFGGKSSPTS